MSFPSQQETSASSCSSSNVQQEAVSCEGEHRGLLINGFVRHSCSDKFLVVLCVEFCKAQSHRLIRRLRDLEPAEQDQRLKFLAHEIKRLLEHPKLFPSETSRIRFLSFLAADSRLQLCEAICSLLMQKEVHTIQESWRQNVSRKGYLEGTRGWENFLLFDAPGLPFSSVRTTPESIVQVMPPVASRIVGDFEREEREILRYLQQNNPPLGRPAQMTTMIDFDNPTEDADKVPDVALPQLVEQAAFRPNPFPECRVPPLDLLTPAFECLEDYSSFIDRLETDPPNPNAPQMVLSNTQILPALSIRTWKLPTEARDLRYIR